MTGTPPFLAIASIRSHPTWNWKLREDGTGLFRWYLDGVWETNLRGVDPVRAESTLCRFVERCIRGELRIDHLPQPPKRDRERYDFAPHRREPGA